MNTVPTDQSTAFEAGRTTGIAAAGDAEMLLTRCLLRDTASLLTVRPRRRRVSDSPDPLTGAGSQWRDRPGFPPGSSRPHASVDATAHRGTGQFRRPTHQSR